MLDYLESFRPVRGLASQQKVNKWYLKLFSDIRTQICMRVDMHTHVTHQKGRRITDREHTENGAEWGWGNEPTEMKLRGGGGARTPAQEQEVGNTKRLKA